MSEVSEDRRVVARQKPDSFLNEEFPLVECPRMLDSGDPGTRIGEIARDEEFDLIIIPTHAGRFQQMLLGSTAAKVLDDAPCPVLTSKHAETIAPSGFSIAHWASLSERFNRIQRSRKAATAFFVLSCVRPHGFDSLCDSLKFTL
jgi:hypothetical protein